MSGANNGIDVHNRHNSVPVVVVVGFKNPQAIVRVGISERLAVFVDKGTFKCLISDYKRKKRCTLATFIPLTPSTSDPVSRRTQSRQGVVIPLVFHFGVDRIVSR